MPFSRLARQKPKMQGLLCSLLLLGKDPEPFLFSLCPNFSPLHLKNFMCIFTLKHFNPIFVKGKVSCKKCKHQELGNMPWWLRALITLLEDSGSIPGAYTVAHNYLYLLPQVIQSPHLASASTAHKWCTNIHTFRILIHIK